MTHYTAHNPDHLGTRVFLDGVEVLDVVECDDAEGWILRVCRNENGCFQMNAAGNDIRRERLEGRVTVERPTG